MNRNYGHLENNVLVYAKNIVTVNNRAYVNPSAEIYLLCDPPEKFIVNDMPADPAPEGYHYEHQGYNETDTQILYNWVVVENQHVVHYRKFSKMYLELALFNAGLLNQIDDFIDSQVITNTLGQEMPLRRLYDKALVFSEDNQYFTTYIQLIKDDLSLTDEDIENILSKCIAEE